MSERKLVQVQFVKTIRVGTSGSMLDYVVAPGTSLKPTRVEESDVELSLSESEQFVKLTIKQRGTVHLIPMSNVSSMILEIAK